MNTRNLWWLVVVIIALSGCVSMEGKFKATAQANVGAFADQTIAMLSSSDLGVAQLSRNSAEQPRPGNGLQNGFLPPLRDEVD